MDSFPSIKVTYHRLTLQDFILPVLLLIFHIRIHFTISNLLHSFSMVTPTKRSSDETSSSDNSAPYQILKPNTSVSPSPTISPHVLTSQPRKWSPEEEDKFLNMINHVVQKEILPAAKKDEHLANRGSDGVKKHWTAMVCH